MTYFLITMGIGQLWPAVPVVAAYFLVRRASNPTALIFAAVAIFVIYLAVAIAQVAVTVGGLSLSMVIGGAYNLLSTVVMPIAWVLLTGLWCYLFYDPRRAVTEGRG